jgi:hypothetical protein
MVEKKEKGGKSSKKDGSRREGVWGVRQGARDAAPLFALSCMLVLLARVPASQLAAPQDHLPPSIASFIFISISFIFHYTIVCCSHSAASSAR